MQNTLISGSTIFDGTGGDPVVADISIVDGRVAEVGADLSVQDAVHIDARGLAAAPGFIDMHSHADFTMPSFPDAINSLSQGVTTEVVGNCGSSPAPLAPRGSELRNAWISSRAIGGDLSWEWTGFSDYLDALGHPSVNTAPLVGHGAVRSAVFGIEDRPPTASELQAMKRLVAEALDAGAWGLSTGLVYPPGRFADTAEVLELAAVVAARGGLYSTHMRDEGARLAESVEEALEVGRRTGVRVEISHLKAAGAANHGRVASALESIESARSAGVAVGCDAYPYTAGSTTMTQLLPPWTMVGGAAAAIERLKSADVRQQIRAEVASDPSAYLNAAGGWGTVMVASVGDRRFRRFEGRMLPELAAAEGKDEFEFLFDLMVDDRARMTMIIFVMDQSDVDTVLDHDATVIGSDLLGVVSPDARVHPRAYGSFARVMRRAADRGDKALADMISRATGRTAGRLGMSDRGLLRPGYVADLVVFDPAQVADHATFDQPTELASGVSKVFLAGRLAFADGAPVDTSLGQVLRREPPSGKGAHR
ncbi:MAG: D-aminoacylase [Acidimicrobiia bacterium]